MLQTRECEGQPNTTWEEVAHDAHVLDHIMTKMEQYVETASDPEKVRQYPWLANWAPIK